MSRVGCFGTGGLTGANDYQQNGANGTCAKPVLIGRAFFLY